MLCEFTFTTHCLLWFSIGCCSLQAKGAHIEDVWVGVSGAALEVI